LGFTGKNMTWNLETIGEKVRAITGTPSTDQLTESQLNSYINNYFVYTMPMELKEQIQNNFLKFKTTPGIDVYAFPNGYFTDSPGAYADGFPMVFYQDPDIFYQDWPQQYAVDNIANGDGSTSSFLGGLQNPPIVIGSLFITDGLQILQDQGDGTLTGNGSGTINYLTGAYSVTFALPPAASLTIYAKYQGYAANRPQGVMFFQNEFTIRPVPDQVYQIQMQGFIIPVTLVNDADTPPQQEWGPLIAYGASLDIFSDRGDLENYERYYPIMKRWENVALSRTIQQYTPMQSVGRF
jgi:hypothetical protein